MRSYPDSERSYPLPIGGDATDVAFVVVDVVVPLAGVDPGLPVVELGPLGHHLMVAEGADEGGAVISELLGPVLRLVRLHEGEVRGVLRGRRRV